VVAHTPALGNAAAYVAAKAGLVGLTKQIALETAGSGVTANVVNPGTIATEHLDDYLAANGGDRTLAATGIPVGRLGTPREVAAAVNYLVGDDAAYTTGTSINVNGGAAFV
jgi:NAD(P)-dependent dehydrogenase (short-subunit alcohol dehydrogenase family)